MPNFGGRVVLAWKYNIMNRLLVKCSRQYHIIDFIIKNVECTIPQWITFNFFFYFLMSCDVLFANRRIAPQFANRKIRHNFLFWFLRDWRITLRFASHGTSRIKNCSRLESIIPICCSRFFHKIFRIFFTFSYQQYKDSYVLFFLNSTYLFDIFCHVLRKGSSE